MCVCAVCVGGIKRLALTSSSFVLYFLEKLLNLFFCLILYIRVFCLHVCLHITFMPATWGGQKRKSDPLGLQMIVSHLVGAVNQTQDLCENS